MRKETVNGSELSLKIFDGINIKPQGGGDKEKKCIKNLRKELRKIK